MEISEYYLDLRFAYPTVMDQTSFPVSLAEISDVLYCTTRNARYILKKMESAGMIVWQPGKGRGNQSQLTFQIPIKVVAILHFKDLLAQEKLGQAVEFINKEGMPAEVRKKGYNQLRSQFGLDPQVPIESKQQIKPQAMTLQSMVRQVKSQTKSWLMHKKSLRHSVFRWPNSKK